MKKFDKAKPAPACFVGDTLVYTNHGVSHIVDIVPGIMVLSRSEATGEIGYRRVVQKFDHGKRDVFGVRYRHENGTCNSVTTTPGHPFWVIGRGWVPAGELQIGQELEICDPEGGTFYGDRPGGLNGVLAQRLRGIRSKVSIYYLGPIEDRKYAVYNIDVEEFHTYFVGDLGAWVHNTKVVAPTLGQAVEKIEQHLEGKQ
jgi:hypothetical protein